MKTHIAAAALLALAGCAHAPDAAQNRPAIELYAMDCGRIQVGDADMFADDGAYSGVSRGLVNPCYLIRHPSADLIWDTGLPEALAAQPSGGAQTGPFQIIMPRTLTSQLADLGMTPGDVEYLSVSHSHFDHVGNAGLFAGALWIVDPDERAHAFRPEARADAESFPAYAALENSRTRLIEGDTDVFGDGTAVIIEAPGHTPGHTVLLLRLQDAGAVLLTGDMFHLAESRAGRRVPRFNVNREQTLASIDKLEELAAAENARVIRQHVPEDFASLPAFPEPLR